MMIMMLSEGNEFSTWWLLRKRLKRACSCLLYLWLVVNFTKFSHTLPLWLRFRLLQQKMPTKSCPFFSTRESNYMLVCYMALASFFKQNSPSNLICDTFRHTWFFHTITKCCKVENTLKTHRDMNTAKVIVSLFSICFLLDQQEKIYTFNSLI